MPIPIIQIFQHITLLPHPSYKLPGVYVLCRFLVNKDKAFHPSTLHQRKGKQKGKARLADLLTGPLKISGGAGGN
jgi:hypothetical protein